MAAELVEVLAAGLSSGGIAGVDVERMAVVGHLTGTKLWEMGGVDSSACVRMVLTA